MAKVTYQPVGRERVYLGLGSNLGDREGNLRYGLELLREHISLERISALYDTTPLGHADQPRFLNCACVGLTSLDPWALLGAVKDVERVAGRRPSFPNGPRQLDVDILFSGHRVILEPGLEVPHPRLGERAFVLVPLTEIAGDYVHPRLHVTVSELLGRLNSDQSILSGYLPQGVRWWAAPISLPRLS